jgi:hypothetical protein
LEKATDVAKKANDTVTKIGMDMEIPVPSVGDISKTVSNFFSSEPAKEAVPEPAKEPVQEPVQEPIEVIAKPANEVVPVPVPGVEGVKGGK